MQHIIDKIRQRFNHWVGAWVEVADAICSIITLTYYIPHWSMTWTTRWSKANLKRAKHRNPVIREEHKQPNTPTKIGKFWYNPGDPSRWFVVKVILKKGTPFVPYLNKYVEDVPGKWAEELTTGIEEKPV